MIEVKERSRELTKVEEYLMTQGTDIEVIKNVADGTSIPVKAWCIFIDHKEEEDVELLSILDTGNKAYSSQSKTFKRAFGDIANLMGEQESAIIEQSGTTNAGRPFVNCSLDTSKLQ